MTEVSAKEVSSVLVVTATIYLDVEVCPIRGVYAFIYRAKGENWDELLADISLYREGAGVGFLLYFLLLDTFEYVQRLLTKCYTRTVLMAPHVFVCCQIKLN